MAINNDTIAKNIEQIKNATYGKEVRAAIADGLELCYKYTSGEGADEAAQRANAAAERVEGMIADSEQAVHDVQDALVGIDNIVLVQPNQPGSSQNKIWIQPQDDTEYKVATFDAYETLWERFHDIQETYKNGHGGIESIALDEDYDDPEDSLKRRYIIHYSDQTTGEFFVNDGETGEQGPVDIPKNTKVFFKAIESENFNPQDPPPTGDFSDNIPPLNPGDYLWTITRITYTSDVEMYMYSLTRIGLNGANGSGAVNGVKIGSDGDVLTGTVVIPLDQEPNAGSGSLLTSGDIYSALTLKANVASPQFTGTPTAPTPGSSDSSTRIATTAFVQSAMASQSVAARQVTLTMNDTTLTYTNNFITESTAVMAFTDIDYSKFSGVISWETNSNHQLILRTGKAPTGSPTFKVLLINTSI